MLHNCAHPMWFVFRTHPPNSKSCYKRSLIEPQGVPRVQVGFFVWRFLLSSRSPKVNRATPLSGEGFAKAHGGPPHDASSPLSGTDRTADGAVAHAGGHRRGRRHAAGLAGHAAGSALSGAAAHPQLPGAHPSQRPGEAQRQRCPSAHVETAARSAARRHTAKMREFPENSHGKKKKRSSFLHAKTEDEGDRAHKGTVQVCCCLAKSCNSKALPAFLQVNELFLDAPADQFDPPPPTHPHVDLSCMRRE